MMGVVVSCGCGRSEWRCAGQSAWHLGWHPNDIVVNRCTREPLGIASAATAPTCGIAINADILDANEVSSDRVGVAGPFSRQPRTPRPAAVLHRQPHPRRPAAERHRRRGSLRLALLDESLAEIESAL